MEGKLLIYVFFSPNGNCAKVNAADWFRIRTRFEDSNSRASSYCHTIVKRPFFPCSTDPPQLVSAVNYGRNCSSLICDQVKQTGTTQMKKRSVQKITIS